MDNIHEKKISKMYRKIISSNTIKAIDVFENLDPVLKKDVEKMLHTNGSKNAVELLQKLNIKSKF